MSKIHTPDISVRFLQLMEEVIKDGLAKNKAAFANSIGEYPSNIIAMEKGTRIPTVEQIAESCKKYGYSANWLILNVGEKKIKPGENLSIERRVSDIEAQLVNIKRSIKRTVK